MVLGENYIQMYQMGYEILAAMISMEMNWMQRQKKTDAAMHYGSAVLSGDADSFHEARQNMIWINRIARSREGCAAQRSICRYAAKYGENLEDSIFTDERLGNGSCLN